jgi:hypothetical protein
LVQQWLKQVVIGAVDQYHPRRCPAQGLRGSQSTKATANYDDSWLSHLLLDLLQSAALDPCSRN